MAALALWRFVLRAVFEHDCWVRLTWSGCWLGEIFAAFATESRLGRVLASALWTAGTERDTAPNAEFLTRGILEVAA